MNAITVLILAVALALSPAAPPSRASWAGRSAAAGR